jgi:transcriptional regulator with XRE-family HTH domain
MREIFKLARKELGEFFKRRRLAMGHSEESLANYLGLSSNTLRGIETGRFACDIDVLLQLCSALEIKPFFTPLEEIGKGSLPLSAKPKFLICPDKEYNQLYILHREFPACLIQVIQSVPMTFKIVDLYDEIEEEELAIHPMLEEAKEFFKAQVNTQPEDLN